MKNSLQKPEVLFTYIFNTYIFKLDRKLLQNRTGFARDMKGGTEGLGIVA